LLVRPPHPHLVPRTPHPAHPLKWEIFKEPYDIGNAVLTIPDRPGYEVELIDDIEQRFPWTPGDYYKRNPVFEGLDLPIWWS